MIKALLESLWLFYLLGALLWGYLGLLAASSQRVPLIVGVLAGVFFWFFGVLAVYLVGLARARSARPLKHPLGGRSTVALVAGLLTSAAILVSVILPWGRGRVAWSSGQQHISGSVQPLHFAPVAVSILVSAVAVAGVVLLDSRARRGTWLGIGAVVLTFWFSLLLEWMLFDTGVNTAADAVSSATGQVANLSLHAAAGAWLMFGACLAGYAWLGWRTAVLLTRRRTASGASATSGWPAAQAWGITTPQPRVPDQSGWGISNQDTGSHTANPAGGWGDGSTGAAGSRAPW